MFDKFSSLLNPSVEMPLGVDESNDFTPFATAFAVEVPYGLRASVATEGEVDLSHALTLSVDNSDPAARLHAVMKGRLRFVPATSTEPARLELQPLPIHLLLLKRNSHLLPLFKQVLYSNVESSSVEEAITALLTKRGLDAAKVAEQLGEFMANTRQFTVAPGDFIGRPAPDTGLEGRRRLDLMIKDREGFFLNPAHFLFQWPTINTAFENHPLLQVLEPTQHRMIFSTKSRTLYVRKNSLTPEPPYGTPATAAHKIQDALSAALAGDIVIVLDNKTYNEKISMPNGLTLTSLSGSKVIGRVGLEPAFPKIECPDDGPAVSFENILLPTNVSGFVITHAATKIGSGILIDSCKNVEVAKNKICFNKTHQGGGIAIVNKSASVFIKQNVISQNEANDGAQELTERGQGGGIYITKSNDITIDDSALYGNTADNFGAGVAIVLANDISIINKNDIGIGAPKYVETSGNEVTKDSPYDSATRGWTQYAIQQNPQGGGGGIGIARSIRIKVKGNIIQHNRSSRGGGIEVYDTCRGVQLIGNHIYKNEARPVPDPDYLFGGDGGGVAVNLISLSRSSALLHSAVTLIANTIEENIAGDDGGGVYGTGKAMIIIVGKDHKIINNQARFNGGGVRATFGSVVGIEGGKITDNTANLGTDAGGGGGTSFFNSSAKIKDCVILNNTVQGFAGGGVYFLTAEYLGVFTGTLFELLLENSYDFGLGIIDLDGCTITSNSALGSQGAAGGLYVIYNQYPIHVKVKASTLSPNFAEHVDAEKRLNVVIVSSSDPTTLINDEDLPPLDPLNYDQLLNP